MAMKNSSDTIWNRNSDLPICSRGFYINLSLLLFVRLIRKILMYVPCIWYSLLSRPKNAQYIQGMSEGMINILGGGSMDYSD